MFTRTASLVVSAALAAATISFPVHAQQASVTVEYGDLDLTSGAGVARLDQRLDSAVRQVCDDRPTSRDLRTAQAVRKCGREAWSDLASPREIAIERANGKQPSVNFAAATGKSALTIRRR